MSGYANRIVTIDCSELAERGEDGKPVERLFVCLKNPGLVPMGELMSKDSIQLDASGQPIDRDAAINSSYGVIANLVVAWNIYDASDFNVDPATGEALPQRKLPLPATPELVAKLPMEVTKKVQEKITSAVNPQ